MISLERFITELKRLLNVFFLGNLFLATIYFALKKNSLSCAFLFNNCDLEMKEWELLTFFGVVIVAKSKRYTTYLDYIGMIMMFGKVMSAYLFFRQNPFYGVLYSLLCIIHMVICPEPTYKGPENVTYFRGQHLEEELSHGDQRISWFIEFYAPWSPSCVKFTPVFSELSANYHLDNLKFGKIDINQYPQVGEKFKIDNTSWSKQLPTIILFEHGKERIRMPSISQKGKRVVVTKENVIKGFGINDLYLQCQKNPIHKNKKEATKKTD